MLLKAGHPIDAVNEFGETPLISLCKHGGLVQEGTDAPFASVFIKAGADLIHRGSDGLTAVHHCFSRGDYQMAAVLLEAVSRNQLTGFTKEELLSFAVRYLVANDHGRMVSVLQSLSETAPERIAGVSSKRQPAGNAAHGVR